MIDTTTWVALGLTLTLLGLVAGAVVWRRRGAASGLRVAAWSLLPAAAGLTGTLRLLADVAGSVGWWAAHLVFSPVVWLGLGLAGVSVVLFGVSAAMRRHTGPAAPSGTASRRAVTGPAKDDDLGDIEEILRRHGIS